MERYDVDVTDLLDDFVSQEVSRLEGRFGRALRDHSAVGDVEWDAGEARAAWVAQKQLTPEAERWPVRLGVSGAVGEAALEEAEAALLAAGGELGMTGAIGGRRALADVGRQAAEAGASLAYALSREPEVEEPVVATPAPERPVPAGADAVQVAIATTLAECELIQNRLAGAGIPSRWRHSAGDVPHLTRCLPAPALERREPRRSGALSRLPMEGIALTAGESSRPGHRRQPR